MIGYSGITSIIFSRKSVFRGRFSDEPITMLYRFFLTNQYANLSDNLETIPKYSKKLVYVYASRTRYYPDLSGRVYENLHAMFTILLRIRIQNHESKFQHSTSINPTIKRVTQNHTTATDNPNPELRIRYTYLVSLQHYLIIIFP